MNNNAMKNVFRWPDRQTYRQDRALKRLQKRRKKQKY